MAAKVPLEYVKDCFIEHMGCKYNEMDGLDRAKYLGLKNCSTIDDLTLWCEYWHEMIYDFELERPQFPRELVFRVIEKGMDAWKLDD